MRLRRSWLAVIGVGATLATASPCWAHQQIGLKLEQLDVEIAEHPDDADLYVQCGELYRLNREWALAEADLEKALDLTPDNPDLQFHLGRLWFEARHPARAIRARPVRRGAPGDAYLGDRRFGHGRWSDLVDASQTDTTGTTGEANFTSSETSKLNVGEFIFAVTDIVIAGRTYDPDANVETSDCVDTQGAQCSSGGNLQPTAGFAQPLDGQVFDAGVNLDGQFVRRERVSPYEWPASKDAVFQNTTSHNVTVTAPNTPPTAAFSESCTDLGCAFTDRSTDGDGTVMGWSWSFGDGNNSTVRNPSHIYLRNHRPSLK